MRTLHFKKSGSRISVFRAVGFFQKHCKGYNFCALIVRVEAQKIHLAPCIYSPVHEEDVMRSLSERFITFEHFLQFIRREFPGISFQDIFISLRENGGSTEVKLSLR